MMAFARLDAAPENAVGPDLVPSGCVCVRGITGRDEFVHKYRCCHASFPRLRGFGVVSLTVGSTSRLRRPDLCFWGGGKVVVSYVVEVPPARSTRRHGVFCAEEALVL